MYVDESGDCGMANSPTNYFILSAIIIHESRWHSTLKSLVSHRRELRELKGLKMREEIHAAHLITKPGKLVRIKRHERVDILKRCMKWVSQQKDASVFSVCVNKSTKNKTSDIFEIAWNALLMRYENTIHYNNFPDASIDRNDLGLIISDNTDVNKLRGLIRKMRHHNITPNDGNYFNGGYRDLTLKYLIEDPTFRDSKDSMMHQMCDVIAYCLRQHYEPNSYMGTKAATKLYFDLNNRVLKVSKSRDGVVNI